MSLEMNGHYQFGAFSLDADQKLLFRDGQPVPLAPKSVETLLALVENADRLVTKQELMNRVWPDTFVEEGNLTFNISQVRKALGDERNNGNRFIETVPKRGYRFVAGLNGNGHGSAAAAPVEEVHALSPPEPPRVAASRPHWFRWWQIPVALALVGVGVGSYEVFRPVAVPTVVSINQLTSDRSGKEELLLTDGLQVYFSEVVNEKAGQFSVPAKGGAALAVPIPLADSSILGVSTDQSVKLLWRHGTLWRAGPPRGFPQRVGNIVDACCPRWSPDGRSIAFAKGNELYLTNVDGTDVRKLLTAPGVVGWIRWSPDGAVLRFTVRIDRADFTPNSIWQIGADGRGFHEVLLDWHNPADECCGDWTPDGKYYVFQSPVAVGAHAEIWAIREKSGLFERPNRPVKVASGPLWFRSPTPSPDGKHVFVIGDEQKGELVVWDQNRREFVPYLGGKSIVWVAFSSDSTWAVFVDYATNTLWRMKADGTEARQLTYEPLVVIAPAISPDGKMIAFRGRKAGEPGSRIYLMPSSGGDYLPILSGHDGEEGTPTWSRDGQSIVYGDVPQAFGKDDGTHTIHVYNLQTRAVTDLPGSHGLWSPRWSPDGRYISAVAIDNSAVKKQELFLYDTQTQVWRDLGQDRVRDPIWSRDSKYLYCKGEGTRDLQGIFRVQISNGASESVASYDNVVRADEWAGLSLEGSPTLLRRLSGEEVYSLEVNWP